LRTLLEKLGKIWGISCGLESGHPVYLLVAKCMSDNDILQMVATVASRLGHTSL